MSQQKAPAPAPQPRRPAAAPAPVRRNSLLSRLPDRSWMLFAAAAVIVAAGVVLQLIWPAGYSLKGGAQAAQGVSEIHGSGPIRLNELMSKNDSTLADENGLTPDWIEVANIGGSAVNLYGYALAQNAKAANVFRFPDLTLQPGECTIVYADSTEGESPNHAPFKLSSQGGSMMLFNRKGTEIDSVNYPAMSSDIAYVRTGQASWEMSESATPGLLNTDENYQALRTPDASRGVEISEVLASNTQYGPDENGAYHDYFELHNTTGAAIDLSGWFVSDDASRPVKWRLPDGLVLQGGEYRLVYASKLDRADAANPHTNFGLSSGGEAVVLSDDKGALVDLVEFGQSETDVAWVKGADGSWQSGTPTPGAGN